MQTRDVFISDYANTENNFFSLNSPLGEYPTPRGAILFLSNKPCVVPSLEANDDGSAESGLLVWLDFSSSLFGDGKPF